MERPLLISFQASPPSGSHALPERQLSLGIRAPPPGPNRAGGGKFKPVAGFVPIGSNTPPAQAHQNLDRSQLHKFFPGDDSQEIAQPGEASNTVQGTTQADNETRKRDPQKRYETYDDLKRALEEKRQAREMQTVARSPEAARRPSVGISQEELFQNHQKTSSQQQPNRWPTRSSQPSTPRQEAPPSAGHELPSAHAPLFPGLVPSHVRIGTPPSQQQNGTSTLPSPTAALNGSTSAGLPSKPNFAGNLLPAFLPQKPTPPPANNGIQLPASLPPPPTLNLSTNTSSANSTPKQQDVNGLVTNAEVAGLANPRHVITPQTPQQLQDVKTSTVEGGVVSAQASPAPSEAPTTKPGDSEMQESSNTKDTPVPPGQNRPATQAPPKIVSSELYERLAQVGEGTYGKVYKARRQDTGRLVALKRIRMEAEKDGFPVTAIREIKLLQALDHPNVLKLMEMMVSKGHVYMVSEYLEHDLTGILNHPNMQSNKFSAANLKSLMQQLLAGLDYIHWRGVLHRDLKGSNILLGRNGDLKIADFGLAKFYDKRVRNDYTNRVITLWYKPPELLFGETVYGPEVDMWSAG